MTADLTASAYLADGVALAASGVELTHDGAGLWSGLAENVAVDTFPGLDGGGFFGGTYPPFTLSTMYTVRGSSGEDAWAKAVALRRRCKPGRTITMTRQMPDPDGTAANTSHTTTARRLTDRPEWLAKTGLVLDIDWLVNAPWYGAAVAISDIAGTHTVAGDTRTRRMTVTLAAGAARTITNTTNGFWFTYSGTVPTGGILVDVEAQTATVISSGLDVSVYLSFGKVVPMQLEAGANVFTVSSGAASISYQPAYL